MTMELLVVELRRPVESGQEKSECVCNQGGKRKRDVSGTIKKSRKRKMKTHYILSFILFDFS